MPQQNNNSSFARLIIPFLAVLVGTMVVLSLMNGTPDDPIPEEGEGDQPVAGQPDGDAPPADDSDAGPDDGGEADGPDGSEETADAGEI